MSTDNSNKDIRVVTGVLADLEGAVNAADSAYDLAKEHFGNDHSITRAAAEVQTAANNAFTSVAFELRTMEQLNG